MASIFAKYLYSLGNMKRNSELNINIGPHMTELGEMGWSDLPRSVSPGQINFNMGERGPGGQVGGGNHLQHSSD